ncbi:MAG: DUF4293 domain-containing protein [Tannerella sp.]|jgi:hypothetical protein|nr:DUF4293 domain-containing protein [Tannerella sp.]
MIQRIQTVFLLAIVALMTATLFMPLAIIQVDELFYTFNVKGLYTTTPPSALVTSFPALLGVLSSIVIIALITIFLYKKRILQIRLCTLNAFLMIGFYGMVAFYLRKISGTTDFFDISNIRLALGFPMISLILNYLAIQSIGADETLIRSLDRIRK